jgi:flagellar hook-length control protein FliK
MDKIIESDIFVIATVRGKDKYVLEEENGKQVPKKVGLGYTQRDDTEYLFTTTFNIDQSTHVASSVKDNTHIFENADEVLTKEHGKKIVEWATGGDLDEKIKAVQQSIDEGKQKQALNDQKEAEELAKNKVKPAKKESKPEVVEDVLDEVKNDVDVKQIIQAIRDEFTRIVGTGKTQKQVLTIMTEAGCAKPSEDTNPDTLIAVLNRLKSE